MGPMGERQRAGHLFGPLLIRSPNPRFLYGPFPVEDMDRPLSNWGYGLAPFQVGDMDRPLSSWEYGLAPFRLGMDMSCTSPCVFCCVSRNLHLQAGPSGTMSRLMFGLMKATCPSCKMRERMRQMCVPCVVRSAPPSQVVVSFRSIIATNVLMPTLVGYKLSISQCMSNTH